MFKLVSPFAPAGDQPQAIAKLTEGVVKKAVLTRLKHSGQYFQLLAADR